MTLLSIVLAALAFGSVKCGTESLWAPLGCQDTCRPRPAKDEQTSRTSLIGTKVKISCPAGRCLQATGIPHQGASSPKKVNPNTATLDELLSLPGIGPARATQIMNLRQRRPFKRPWDLTRVRGIGPKTVRRLVPLLRFDE